MSTELKKRHGKGDQRSTKGTNGANGAANGTNGHKSVNGKHKKTEPRSVTLLLLPWASAGLLLVMVIALMWQPEVVHDTGLLVENSTRFTVGPRGAFPKKCVWRELHNTDSNSSSKFEFSQSTMYNHTVSLEYLHPNGSWDPVPPKTCTIMGAAIRQPWQWSWATKDGPRSDVDCRETYCTYQNLWYNKGQWFVLVHGPMAGGTFSMSKHVTIRSIHVHQPKSWLKTVKWAVVPGETFVVDYPWPSHPTAIGHWPELLSPLYSILRNDTRHFGKAFKRIPDQFVLLSLQRKHFMEWIRGLLATTLGIMANKPLPPIFTQHAQVAELDGVDNDLWICFPRALVVKDYNRGGSRNFDRRDHARAFRDAIHARHGLKPTAAVTKKLVPENPKLIPKTITFLRKSSNRRIVNEGELLDTLREFGPLNVVEFNSTTSMKEQLKVMAMTGLLVSTHSSQLANAMFLHPGSAVLEIIHRNWNSPYDLSFKTQTEGMGDIHHFAWRCNFANCTSYIDERFGELYGNMTMPECMRTSGCMDKHTNVDIHVDTDAIRSILKQTLPKIWSDDPPSVKAAGLPWPKII